jgi:hypothetical protein
LKTKVLKVIAALTLCAGLFSLASCKEKSTINADLIPDVDNINTFAINNLDITIQNKNFDSLATNVPSYPIVAIGRIAGDPIFGKTQAGAYLQFAPPAAFTWPADMIMDSIVLYVPYTGSIYGDSARSVTANTLNFKVHEITELFNIADLKTWYNFSTLGYNSNALANVTIPVKNLYDTVALANGDTVNNLLRINLSSLMSTFKNFTSADLASASAFTSVFRGLYIGAGENINQNALAYFDLYGANSTTNYANAQLVAYYHTASSSAPVTKYFRFNNSDCSFFNQIKRDYTGTVISNYASNTNRNSDSLIIQGAPGMYAQMKIKLDNKIPESVINKATLTITALNLPESNLFFVMPQLIVNVVEDDGTQRYAEDMLNADGTTNVTGQSFMKGGLDSATINGVKYMQYKLNLPRELQRAIREGKSELNLKITGLYSYYGSFRIIANGYNNNSDTKLKFDVIYTKKH